MQQQVTASVSHTRKLIVYGAYILLVVALWWVGNNVWAVSPAPVQNLPATRVLSAKNVPIAAPVITRDGVTVYGGNYTVILTPVRFVSNSDGKTAMLVLDLKYSNNSPFVIEIVPSSQIHARVFDDRGALVGTFVASQGALQPGSVEMVAMTLGTDYSLQRDSGRQFLVLVSDAGDNLHGQDIVEMPELY